MKIAVVGSGVSGLSAAWLLAPHNEVTLFEKESRLGGHAHTIEIQDDAGKMIPVDTGFMVFNPAMYPNFMKLIEHFDVPAVSTSMSFSVSMDNGAFEFSSNAPDGLFADRENIVRASFYEFLLEITRFNSEARKALERGISPHQTLHAFVEEHGFSEDLEEKYLLPLVGSIWSTPKKLARDFPSAPLLTFLNNHHLLAVTGHPQWATIVGGSSTYVARVVDEIRQYGGTIRTGVQVSSIRRTKEGPTVAYDGKKETFDYVVLATHADTTLALLKDASREEKILLSKFEYETNKVYVHSDASLMPRRKEAWASWNYLGRSGWSTKTKKVSLTYHMNTLQHLSTETPVFITLNPVKEPKRSLTHKVLTYTHPMSTCASMEMRSELATLQNKNRTLFCGSYFGYGFHEDGITSAIEVVRHLGGVPPWELESI